MDLGTQVKALRCNESVARDVNLFLEHLAHLERFSLQKQTCVTSYSWNVMARHCWMHEMTCDMTHVASSIAQVILVFCNLSHLCFTILCRSRPSGRSARIEKRRPTQAPCWPNLINLAYLLLCCRAHDEPFPPSADPFLWFGFSISLWMWLVFTCSPATCFDFLCCHSP